MNSDLSEVGEAIGAIRGMTVAVRTPAYINAVLTLAHDRMAIAFDEAIDLVSEEGRSPSLQHVYDWPQDGAPLKLWKHTLIGLGASREASFEFLPSVRPIPTPQERASNPNDPISLVPPEELARLSQRRYIFQWKAPIMEYNTPVTIRAKNVSMLFIPTGIWEHSFVFAESVQVNNPGGNVSTGRFTAFWTDWWDTAPDDVFESQIKNILEHDLANIPIGTRSRNKVASLYVNVGMAQSMKIGEAATLKYMEERSAGYRRAVRATRGDY